MQFHSASDRSVGYLFLMRARVAKYPPRTTFHTASPRNWVNRVGGRRDLPPAQSGFIAPFCALGYYVSYLVELGEWPCRGFGSGCRSGFACGLLWWCIGYHRPLYCLNPVRLDRFILGSHIFLAGCRCRSDVRWGEPLAAGPGAGCQMGPRHEYRAALGPRLVCVRGFLVRVSSQPLCWGASRVDGDGRDPGHRVPVCHPRGLPLHGSAGPSDHDRGGGYILRFVARRVARHLVGSWRRGLALRPPCASDRGVHLVGCRAGNRGGATPRLIPNLCLPSVAVLRALREPLLCRTP